MMQYTVQQQAIIQHSLSRHALVSAVAGSGKTQTLLGRISFLLQQGVCPDQILVVMFNKSAQKDFQKRLQNNDSSKGGHQVKVKTFHALGLSILQRLVHLGYLESNFTLMTNTYHLNHCMRQAIRQVSEQFKMRCDLRADTLEQLFEAISLIKSQGLEQLSNKQQQMTYPIDFVKAVYQVFENQRIQNHWVTLDDLITDPVKWLSNHTKAKSLFQEYSHIIVDEYQDINQAQQLLLQIVAGDKASLMVVGDVDQTIYEWRGSQPYFMLKGFKKTFQPTDIYTLSYTFRFGHLTALMANTVIQNNQHRYDQSCLSKSGQSTDVHLMNGADTSYAVACLKKILQKGTYEKEQIGVLVRQYSSAILFELNCLIQGVDYHLQGAKGVFDLPITRAIYGYLLFMVDQWSVIAAEQKTTLLAAMMSFPDCGLNNDQRYKLAEAFAKSWPKDYKDLQRIMALFKVTQAGQQAVSHFVQRCQELMQYSSQTWAAEALHYLYQKLELMTYLHYQGKHQYFYTDEAVAKGLKAFFQRYRQKTLQQLMQKIITLYESALHQKAPSEQAITICSIHRAKGLQWPLVVLCDMTEGAFFQKNQSIDAAILEQERRLFYVAMTRAEEQLWILGGNDIQAVNDWTASPKQRYPNDLSSTNSVRFLYESNPDQCHAFLNAVANHDKKTIKKMTKRFYSMKQYYQQWVQQ